jgi:hypothetical protein
LVVVYWKEKKEYKESTGKIFKAERYTPVSMSSAARGPGATSGVVTLRDDNP